MDGEGVSGLPIQIVKKASSALVLAFLIMCNRNSTPHPPQAPCRADREKKNRSFVAYPSYKRPRALEPDLSKVSQ